MVTRARLTPETAKIRSAVTDGLSAAGAIAGDTVLVACSGGQDSLALAVSAAFVCKRDGLQVGAIVIDHQLQPNSAEIAQDAAEACRLLGLDPVVVRSVRVQIRGEGLEAAARIARYRELEAVRSELGAKLVLLGHTLDDQAETVLLGLSRGSGIHSISGMNVLSGCLLRPLLGVSRVETAAVCQAAGLKPWIDPHNTDERFARARIRNQVLPVLERELGPGMASALARTADLARADDTELTAQAQAVLDEISKSVDTHSIQIPALELAKLSKPIASRLVMLVLRRLQSASNHSHISSVLELVTNWHGQRTLDLPGVKVERAGGVLVFRAARP